MDGPLGVKHYVLAALFVLFHLNIAFQSWRSRARVAGMKVLPTRSRHFMSTIFTQIILVSVALVVAFAFRFRLFPPVMPRVTDVLLGLVAAAGLIAFMWPRWRAAVRRGDRRLYFFMPQGPKEKAWWVGVSVAAGIGEEITYRGVLFLLVLLMTKSMWIAALASAVVFAAGHAFQGRLSMIIIFGFALVFQALAILSGSLYVSMLVHAIYDVAAGFGYSRLGRTMGYVAEGDPSRVAPSTAAAQAPGAATS